MAEAGGYIIRYRLRGGLWAYANPRNEPSGGIRWPGSLAHHASAECSACPPPLTLGLF